MDIPSLIVGGLVLLVAGSLQWFNRQPQSQQPRQCDDQPYLRSRVRHRTLVNGLLALVGCVALGAGVVGYGPAFALLWAAVPLLIFIIVVLALVDAFRTQQYFQSQLDQATRIAQHDETASATDP